MTKPEEIIEKLKFTVAMCEYDPLTGDIIERCFMNDMTRTTYDGCKAAIEFIEKHQYVHDKCKKCIEFSEFIQTDWIPVSERLPKLYEKVLVTVNTEVSIGWREEDGWRIVDYISLEKYADSWIRGWMPLPEPYKAESEGKK